LFSEWDGESRLTGMRNGHKTLMKGMEADSVDIYITEWRSGNRYPDAYLRAFSEMYFVFNCMSCLLVLT
jgi:hypothetical protein